MTNEPRVSTTQTQEPTSLHRAALEQAAWWLFAGTVILLVFHWGDSPLQSAGAIQRIAIVALPTIVAASYLEAAATRSAHLTFRALGGGIATALGFIVIVNAERIVSADDPTGLFLKLLVTVPLFGCFFAVPRWIHATYLEKNPAA